jgi:hypothetical protein
MEKQYTLEQKEQAMLAGIDQERTNALAMVGALSLDMEQARKNLDNAAERQRAFLRQALANRGVERFDNARVQNGALLVTVPDEMPTIHQEAAGPKVVERVNGSVSEVRE